MSFTIHGIGVSGGIAIGHAHLLTHAQLEVAALRHLRGRGAAGDRRASTTRSPTARTELAALSEHIPANAPPEFEGFLNLHLMILGDSTLSEVPKRLIAARKCNAEWAV